MEPSGKDRMSPAAEFRKNNKPLMEKRRRARINLCLNQLKALVVDAMMTENTKCSKLEKADILEMTVRHLRNVQRQRLAVSRSRTDPDIMSKYLAGFNECAAQVSRFMSTESGHENIRVKLLSHLASCLQNDRGTATPTDMTPDRSVPTTSSILPTSHVGIPSPVILPAHSYTMTLTTGANIPSPKPALLSIRQSPDSTMPATSTGTCAARGIAGTHPAAFQSNVCKEYNPIMALPNHRHGFGLSFPTANIPVLSQPSDPKISSDRCKQDDIGSPSQLEANNERVREPLQPQKCNDDNDTMWRPW